jgi:hypothetical protein
MGDMVMYEYYTSYYMFRPLLAVVGYIETQKILGGRVNAVILQLCLLLVFFCVLCFCVLCLGIPYDGPKRPKHIV